ncbi:hypothetical protein ACFYY8_24125 [Streptosporangium sp. NPDC001559]|uniref:hypothetical protein n=1 Tax=Streptosporangium sp. NPDC001559 TaxID=3366187 RepID=UPI0036EF9044
MAVLLVSALDSLRVYLDSTFLITEVEDGIPTGSPSPGDGMRMTLPRIGAGPNGVRIASVISSEGPDQRGGPIHVRYELWDAEPGLIPSWERMWEGRLHLRSGRIGIVEEIGEEGEEIGDYLEFDTGRRDSTWSARVLTRYLSNTDEPDFPATIVDVDLYRMQLWPV